MSEQLEKYRNIRPIARGGMADVFEADRIGASGFVKPVCLKQIRSEFSDNLEFVRMFESEARIVATLQHQNIVQVFDFKRYDEQLLLEMELVEGLDLRRILGSTSRMGLRLPIELVMHVMEGLLAALGHAHGRRVDDEPKPVVHRDVSPHNILISKSGDVKLTDFGIAKVRGLSDMTQVGMIKGKMAYLSPEQAKGETVLPASDLFSAGIVFWEMLAGERLFQGEDEVVIAQVLVKKIPDIPGISDELNRIMQRFLARELEERFESAAVALAALKEIDVSRNGAASAERVVTSLMDSGKYVEGTGSVSSSGESTTGSSSSSNEEPGHTRRSTSHLAPQSLTPSHSTSPSVAPPARSLRGIGAWITMAAVAAVAIGVIVFSVRGNRGQPIPTSELVVNEEAVAVVKEEAVAAIKEEAAKEEEKSEEIPVTPAVQIMEPSEPASSVQEKEDSAASPEKKPASEQQTKTGRLDVYVRPWAKVVVDGLARGTTPIKNIRLKPGDHRVVLSNKKLGYHRSLTVHVRAGKTRILRKNIVSSGGK
ncbi:MAG: serine/threonine protein kinase [Deltaproteobacteria bacterium]|nr:serine/threonine protein kinase [Deltaproteobacteria bacterium]